jgi:hypothetical protein
MWLQICDEAHSTAFAEFYDTDPDGEWLSSALLKVELTRAVMRARPALLPEAHELLLAFSCIAIDDDVIQTAMNEPDRGLRSPGAIHLEGYGSCAAIVARPAVRCRGSPSRNRAAECSLQRRVGDASTVVEAGDGD